MSIASRLVVYETRARLAFLSISICVLSGSKASFVYVSVVSDLALEIPFYHYYSLIKW